MAEFQVIASPDFVDDLGPDGKLEPNRSALDSLAAKVGATLPENITLTLHHPGARMSYRWSDIPPRTRDEPLLHKDMPKGNLQAYPGTLTELDIIKALGETLGKHHEYNPAVAREYTRDRRIALLGASAIPLGIGSVLVDGLAVHTGILGAVGYALFGLGGGALAWACNRDSKTYTLEDPYSCEPPVTRVRR